MSGEKKWGRFIRFGATAAPLEPNCVLFKPFLGLTPIRVRGGTKVRDHPKAVGSCASAVTVRVSYRDVYTTYCADTQGRHPVEPDVLRPSTAPTWLWLLARCDVYDM